MDTINKIRSGPYPSNRACIALSIAFSLIVTAVIHTSSKRCPTFLLVRMRLITSSASLNCGMPLGLPKFVTSIFLKPHNICCSASQTLASVGINFSSCWKPSLTVISPIVTLFGYFISYLLFCASNIPNKN